MAIEKDNYIDPNVKARWGFGGSEGNITVGPQTVGETGGVDSARTESDETAARGNGGGVDDSEALRNQLADVQGKLAQARSDLAAARGEGSDEDPLDKLTTAQIKEQLDAKGITYKASDAKPELLAALKAAQ